MVAQPENFAYEFECTAVPGLASYYTPETRYTDYCAGYCGCGSCQDPPVYPYEYEPRDVNYLATIPTAMCGDGEVRPPAISLQLHP